MTEEQFKETLELANALAYTREIYPDVDEMRLDILDERLANLNKAGWEALYRSITTDMEDEADTQEILSEYEAMQEPSLTEAQLQEHLTAFLELVIGNILASPTCTLEL